MKTALFIFLSFLAWRPAQKIAVVDMTLKLPISYTDAFTNDLIFKKKFPVYANELKLLSDATQEAAKQIHKGVRCNVRDTVTAGHTLIIIIGDCSDDKLISVVLKTQLEDMNIFIPIVTKEVDKRKAQMKLIDFATYLADGE